MWSSTCWQQGEIEQNPELRAARALKELEGWPEEVCHHTFCPATSVLHTPTARRKHPITLLLLKSSALLLYVQHREHAVKIV